MSKFFFFLFARPSFLEGAARVIDFGDTLTEFNSCLTPKQADYYALLSDWYVIGGDLRQAMREFADSAGKRPQRPSRELVGSAP